MKKVILLLGIISLTACTTDSVFDEHDQYNKEAFMPTEQSNYQPMTSVGDYETPWDFNILPVVNHYFEYLRWDDDSPYIRVTPYIGLAYYDGADDGTYNTPAGAFNLAAGGYPNLYNNGLEAGNYIEANPIILGVNTYSTHELAIMPNATFPNDHCQVQGADINPYNPEGVFLI